ncbi:hypothetical protein ACSX1A_13040 [Pontibacter sp. MBLB2868]|uniref:hypothetical protein n=1 Tax=Pontibacter sp. MBLB2868 TaxID=3451555 RepID=UPI003F7528EF
MQKASVSNAPSTWLVLPHYAFAALSFIVLSVLLLFSSDAFGGHYFHPKLLTLTHVAVLGWATMLIFGILYQLLPVVLDGRLYSEKLAAITFALLGSGTFLLAYSFWYFQAGWVMQLGAGLLFLAFLVFNINVVQTARKAPKWTIEADFIVTAALWLLVTGLIGLLMALNFTIAFLPQEHVHYLQLHSHIGMAGWFLLLFIGIGAKLIPGFLLAHPVATGKLAWSYNCINAGLLLFMLDHMVFGFGFWMLYAALVMAGIVLFLLSCLDALKNGKRKKLHPGTRQIFVALALLLLPLVLLFVVTSDLGLPQSVLSSLYLVYGLTVFLGSVTALLLGQTFKILPILGSVHTYEDHKRKCNTSLSEELYSPALLRWQNISYLAGFVMLLAGVFLRWQQIILGGAIGFNIAAFLYAANVFQVLLYKARSLNHLTYPKINN